MRRVRAFFAFTLLSLSALACNAPFIAGTSTATNSSPTAQAALSDGPPPKLVIEAPANGSQAVISKPFSVRAHATDSIGITRIEMHESGRIVVSQPSPDPNPDFTALLEYRPSSVGKVTLEVVAYRQKVASQPMSIEIEIVGSEAELKNPASLDGTSGAAAGAICTIRVNVSGLNMRSGPGVSFQSIGKLKVADELAVIGRNTGSSWYEVKRDTTVGWVSAPYVSVATGDCGKAPETTPSP